MTVLPHLPSVFEYLDYRRFLADWFEARRRTDSGFSLRAFALKAGLPLSNSSFFSKVINGKRNLTLDLQFRIAKAMKLSPSEIRYFGLMVQMEQSRDPESKRHIHAELASHPKSKARILGMEGTAKKSEDSIRTLLSLGLIDKTADGYAWNERKIAADNEGKDPSGRLRILEMLMLAAEMFPHLPAQDREFNLLTVHVSKRGYQSIREKIWAFRDEVKALVQADSAEDRIYTLALQLFPNTKLPEWGGPEDPE
jgi:transcriptional regulator with XRE-family HTH domain